MLRWVVMMAALLFCLGQAAALTAETVAVESGGPKTGAPRELAPVWRMKCPENARLVGLRIHKDARIAGVEAICARFRLGPDGLRWVSNPELLPPLPEPETLQVHVAEPRAEGTVLRANSHGVTRHRGSRALIITIERPKEHEPAGQGPIEEPPDRVEFRTTRASSDIVCDQGRFVSGIRIGSQVRRRVDHLVAVQLLCSNGTTAAPVLVGDWPAATAPDQPTGSGKKKKRKKAAAPPLSVQRIECRRAEANPHDGEAANAVFGTIDDGRITTLGLSCARNIDDTPATSRTYAALRDWMSDAGKAVAWPRQFDEPTWFDGSPVGVCEDGSGALDCIQASADRYCTEIAGYGRALHFDVSIFSREAVFSSGRHCPRRACRSFAAITCAL